MNNIIHFFDLDGTLWELQTKAWLIHKKYPNNPLIILTNGQLNDILFGVYKNDEIRLEYNGKLYWISKKMFDSIKKKIPSIKEEDLGISFIEKVNPDYYKELIFYKENIRHLINEEGIDIGIISGRYSEENDQKILALLKTQFDNIGLEINKFYYVSDYFEISNSNKLNFKKLNILLEHLVGFKIVNDHFVPIKQDLYQTVYFYDDEYQNISVSNDIQNIFEEYLRNTDDEVYQRIMLRVKELKPTLYTNLVSNNNINRFKTTKIVLQQPKTFPIKVEEKNIFITKFNKFIND